MLPAGVEGGEMVFSFLHVRVMSAEHHLNATDDLSVVADPVHPFMATASTPSHNYLQQDNTHKEMYLKCGN